MIPWHGWYFIYVTFIEIPLSYFRGSILFFSSLPFFHSTSLFFFFSAFLFRLTDSFFHISASMRRWFIKNPGCSSLSSTKINWKVLQSFSFGMSTFSIFMRFQIRGLYLEISRAHSVSLESSDRLNWSQLSTDRHRRYRHCDIHCRNYVWCVVCWIAFPLSTLFTICCVFSSERIKIMKFLDGQLDTVI